MQETQADYKTRFDTCFKEQDTQLHPDGYNEKRTRPRNSGVKASKRGDKSHWLTASTDPKSPYGVRMNVTSGVF